MLSTLRNSWKVPDLKKRMLWTLFLIAVFRFGNIILVPGIDRDALQRFTQTQTLANFYDLISGGAFSQLSIFAMGVYPYINASIIIQLLTVAIPKLEQLSKEGEDGRKKINQYTRYTGVLMCVIQALSTYYIISNQRALLDTSKLNMVIIMITLTAASMFLVWLGDQITVKGLGNGISLLIFVNIISRFPMTIYKVVGTQKAGGANIVEVVMLLAFIAALLAGVILMSLGERRIPVQYAGKTVGNKTYKGQSSHIPINVNSSGVIAIIFAMSVMQFPGIIAQITPGSKFANFIGGNYSIFKPNSLQYAITYFVLIIFFSWFYMGVTFKPDEMAENMHKSSGFIPGIRPGQPTAKFIDRILTKISIMGGIFAGFIAVTPIIIEMYTPFKGIYFGGTSLLIMVGVAVESVRVLESQLVMRHYQGFLK